MSRATDAPASKHAGPAEATPAPRLLRTNGDLRQAIDLLRQGDPSTIGPLVAAVGYPALRHRPPGFAGLAAIIVGQQVSTASAAAIFSRLTAALVPLTAEALEAAEDDVLRACGLSRGKIRGLRAVAEAVQGGRLSFDRLAAMPADVAHAELVAITGIGPWTADVFLLFGLGEADAWPAGDIALQEAARLLLGLPERPDAAALTKLGTRWRPYRGAVAHLLWAYYRHAKGRQGIGALPGAAAEVATGR